MASKITRNYLPELFALGFFRTRPSMVTVNLTRRCNQHCIYCEIGKTQSFQGKDSLTFEDLQWVIDQMAINKIPRISLCGGEPFLFQRLIDVVAYAGEKNIRCSITTNGMTAHMLTEDELTILKECNTEVNISVDSFQDSIQGAVRGTPAALANAVKSIRLLSKKQIPVTVLTVISKYNFKELYKFFTAAYEMGIQQVLFQPVIYYSNYPDQIPLDDKSSLNVSVDGLDRLMVELNKIFQFEKDHPIKSNVYRIFPWIKSYLDTASAQSGEWFFGKVLKKFYCREIYAIIDINYDGGIQPCGLSLASISIMKNREQGLMGLWREATEKIRTDLYNGRYYDYCNGCCHHFSRNMLASIIKYPVQNRNAFLHLMPLLLLRTVTGITKKLKGRSR